MTIVDQTAAVEATREQQRATVLVLAELLEHDLPTANLSLHDDHPGQLSVTFYSYDVAVHGTARADFEAWLDFLDLAEYEESKASNRTELTASGPYKDVTIRLRASLTGTARSATVTRRTVTA